MEVYTIDFALRSSWRGDNVEDHITLNYIDFIRNRAEEMMNEPLPTYGTFVFPEKVLELYLSDKEGYTACAEYYEVPANTFAEWFLKEGFIAPVCSWWETVRLYKDRRM